MVFSCALVGNSFKVAKTVPETSILVPESLLHPSKGAGVGQLIYVAPDVKWASYTKIILNPVNFWRGAESKTNEISQENAQILTIYFDKVIHEALSQYYESVSMPGPDTIQVTAGLTKLNESNPIPNVASTFVSQARLLSTVVSFATEKPAFVAEAAVQSRLTDSQTGRILAAGVDECVGNRRLTSNSFSSWGDVENIMKFWGQRATDNLCEVQKGSDCVKSPSRG